MIAECRRGALAFFACLVTVGCAGTSEEPEGQQTQELERNESDLRPAPMFYSVEENLLPCLPPQCGGYDVHPLNDVLAHSSRVTEFDFSPSGLTPEEQRTALRGPMSEVILKGILHGSRFVVYEAYRGLPNVAYKRGAGFYMAKPSGIVCITEPCPTVAATLVNVGKKEPVSGIEVTRATQPKFVQESWVLQRVNEGRAILAGGIVDIPGAPPVGTPRVLMAEQVFIRLPEVAGPCPLEQVLCEEPGTTPTFTRTPDRCIVFDSCEPWGVCPPFMPSCGEGYKLVRWSAGDGFACPDYACDPNWAN